MLTSTFLSRIELDPGDSDGFAAHLTNMLSLEESHIDSLLESAENLCLTRSQFEREAILDRLQASTGLGYLELAKAASVLRYLCAQVVREETPITSGSDLEREIIESGVLQEEDATRRDRFRKVIGTILEKIGPRIKPELLKRDSASGVIPSILSCSTAVDLRAVQSIPYQWGAPVSSYNPTVRDVVGIVSIKIEVDSSQPSELAFQVDATELDLLIDSLTAARADLRALTASVQFIKRLDESTE